MKRMAKRGTKGITTTIFAVSAIVMLVVGLLIGAAAFGMARIGFPVETPEELEQEIADLTQAEKRKARQKEKDKENNEASKPDARN